MPACTSASRPRPTIAQAARCARTPALWGLSAWCPAWRQWTRATEPTGTMPWAFRTGATDSMPIPWRALSSRTCQLSVRLAYTLYTLDELDIDIDLVECHHQWLEISLRSCWRGASPGVLRCLRGLWRDALREARDADVWKAAHCGECHRLGAFVRKTKITIYIMIIYDNNLI